MRSIKKSKTKPKEMAPMNTTFRSKKNQRRISLCVSIDKRYKCLYHPLKQKYVNPKRLHFIDNTTALRSPKLWDRGKTDKYVTEKTVISWMLSVGIKVKKISKDRYLVDNRVKNFTSIIMMANKKRVDLKLTPFLVEGILDNEC